MTTAPTRPQRSAGHGTEDEGRDRAVLTGFLRRIDRRDRLTPVLRGALAGAALALVALLAKALLESSGLLPSPGGALLAGLAWLLPAAGAAAGYRREDLRRAAALGDRRGELQDLLKTAHGIDDTAPIHASWRPLLERRAAARVAGLDAARLAPTPWRTIATLAVLLLAVTLARWIPTAPPGAPSGALRLAPDGAAAAADPAPEDATAAAAVAASSEAEPPPPPRLRLSVDDLPVLEPGAGTPIDPGDAELGAAESGVEAGEGEAAPSAQGAGDAADELLQEVRRQLEEQGPLPSAAAAEAGAESGESAAPAAGDGPTPPAGPSLEQVSDELTAIEAPTSTPSSQLSRRSAGTAEVAVPAGMEVAAGDAPREGSESGDPGVAEGGASTAPQEGFVDPLGAVATELEVTLELALLESRREETARETTREMTPSRAAESTLRASARSPVAPARESAPARRPVPWTYRPLVRSYFDPSAPTPTAPAEENDSR
ncbi:MAG TPA: hypothetical protein VMV46_14165 [Thermoanaerobaculia bacterium]|nr:hypothetical protein [Thermoanaerobaculia bacterium]